jgi:hypothetical protein
MSVAPIARARAFHALDEGVARKLGAMMGADGALLAAALKGLAFELGNPDYSGTADENVWLHGQVFKAIQQRGIPMPNVGV